MRCELKQTFSKLSPDTERQNSFKWCSHNTADKKSAVSGSHQKQSKANKHHHQLTMTNNTTQQKRTTKQQTHTQPCFQIDTIRDANLNSEPRMRHRSLHRATQRVTYNLCTGGDCHQSAHSDISCCYRVANCFEIRVETTHNTQTATDAIRHPESPPVQTHFEISTNMYKLNCITTHPSPSSHCPRQLDCCHPQSNRHHV